MKRFQKREKMFFLSVLLGLMVLGLGAADEPIGVFANTNTNCIQMIDPTTKTASAPMLKGQLGSYGGGLFDLVIAPHKKIVVVSNFGDSKIHFIDISGGFAGVPVILGTGYVSFFAEDMVVTPDEKYVLVTDGGFSPRIAVMDMVSHNNVHVEILKGNQYANAVDITPNGDMVIVANYFNGTLHSYDFNKTNGDMTFRETQTVLPNRPVNVAISPDGRTVIAPSAGNRKLPVFYIDSAKNLCRKPDITMPSKSAQSGVFSADGKAYILSNSQNGTYVHEYTVTPGKLTFSRSLKLQNTRGTSQLFGVDTIAIDPAGKFLYVTNPTVSGGKASVVIVNLTTLKEAKDITAKGITTGIAFATIDVE